MQSVSPSQYQCSAIQLPSLQRNSLSEHLRMSGGTQWDNNPAGAPPATLLQSSLTPILTAPGSLTQALQDTADSVQTPKGKAEALERLGLRLLFCGSWGVWLLCPSCSPPAAPGTWAVQGSGSARAPAALSPHGHAIHQPPRLPPWSAAHHTAHRCCHHSRCHHRSATGSGCSSRSGRGTRLPHTPAGLWAQSGQAATGSGASAWEPSRKPCRAEQPSSSDASQGSLGGGCLRGLI